MCGWQTANSKQKQCPCISILQSRRTFVHLALRTTGTASARNPLGVSLQSGQTTMKFILTIIFSFFICSIQFGQADKKLLLTTFDKFEYYPDSTIKCVYKIKRKKFHGYSIEFDEKGQPNYIGRYDRGEKWWYWFRPDNSWDYYRDGFSDPELLPGCGLGQSQDFKKLYADILAGKDYTK